MHLQSGTLLQGGKYRIIHFIKNGGFGCTYEAWHTGFDARVAIKEFFPKNFCNRESDNLHVTVGTESNKTLIAKLKHKFIDEARALRKLSHPSIVKVSDVFEENGTAYYVMDYIEGSSLEEVAERTGPMSESDALSYIREVCSALSYVHSCHRLHLDIKPGNVMVDNEGHVILIDFGTSKQYDEESNLNTSTLLGMTFGYAPLEQSQEGGVREFHPSTDIYALGATFYRLLTGQTPPNASHVNEFGLPPLPHTVSALVRSAVERAMSPKRIDRPQDVDEFLELLDAPVVTVADEETTVPGQDTGSSGHHNPRIKKWPWLMLAVVAAVLLLSLSIFRPFEPDDLSSDLSVYKEFLHLGDSLSMHEESLSESRSAYDSASFYEQKYSGSRYSRRFRGTASSKSASVQVRIDSLRVSDSLAAIAAAEAAAARAEQERQEREAREAEERRRKEEEDRKRNETSYINGILRVKGVEYPMVYVSGGSFEMGATSEQDDYAYDLERPVHRVTLSSYSIGKYEVTQELWEAVMGDNPSRFKGPRRPVEQVSWDDCMVFIDKLNALTGASFRLPTEAEWEFAARGGNSSRGCRYSGSDTIGNVAWYEDNSGDQTHDVGLKSPNELGIYDMSGNVWEWCSDWFGEYSSSSQTNPKGPGSGSFRVFRGGSWSHDAWRCRVSLRISITPGYRYCYLGLRLCL